MKARYRTRQHKAAQRKKRAAKLGRRCLTGRVTPMTLPELIALARRLHNLGLTMTGRRIGADYVPGPRQAYAPLLPHQLAVIEQANERAGHCIPFIDMEQH